MAQSTNEIIGRLRGLAMDTLQSTANRNFFTMAADRLNDVDIRGRLAADDVVRFKGFADAVLSAYEGIK